MQQSVALENLYRTLARPLWGLLYARCCDADRALDAVQEAFLRYHQYSGPPIRDPRAWLLKVAANWLCDAGRRERRVSREPLPESLSCGTADPSDLTVTAELHEQVRAALADLAIEDREVLVLRYALDWSSERIANTLGIQSSAVDMRLTRARRRLAAALAALGVSHETV